MSGLVEFFKHDEPVKKFKDTPVFTLTKASEVKLADIRLKHVDSKDRVELKGTIGWSTVESNVVVIYRIRRKNINGNEIFRTKDGIGVDQGEENAQTTSFSHVDKTKRNEPKYVLTGQVDPALSIGDTAFVNGPIVFIGTVYEKNS